MSFEELDYVVDEAVARITLNRPAKLNAITQKLYRELAAAFTLADSDPNVDVVVLTGAGRAFCAGGDLSEVNDMHSPERALELAGAAHNSSSTFRLMEMIDKPIVCLVNGLAHAAGFILAIQSDVVIASDRARFRLPEALRGMAEPYAAAHLWAHIGVARTKYLLFTCDEIDAAQAERWGVVARVVPHDELETEGRRVVAAIRATGEGARRWNKAMVNRVLPVFDSRSLKETITSNETESGTRRFSKSDAAEKTG